MSEMQGEVESKRGEPFTFRFKVQVSEVRYL